MDVARMKEPYTMYHQILHLLALLSLLDCIYRK